MESQVSGEQRAALMQAKVSEWIGDWGSAERHASLALEMQPTLVPAYMVRALARRIQGDLPAAIADYEKVIGLDPQCAHAWEYRGACRAMLAARLPRAAARELQAQAEQDYRRATLLDPANEQAALAMVEAAICAERYLEAFGHAGECWRTVRGSAERVICAWLGCVAGLLARRPPTSIQPYAQLLRRRTGTLSQVAWSTAEVNGAIARVYQSRTHDAQTMAEIEAVNSLFLSHFEQGGPLLC